MKWAVTAWCEAPGDFPSVAIRTVIVQAQTAVDAVALSLQLFADGGNLNPRIVYVERVDPSWRVFV